jgi:Protein of unknown function (DUF559)
MRRAVPIGAYVADFACLVARVVIEVNGGQHVERRDHDQRQDREIEGYCGSWITKHFRKPRLFWRKLCVPWTNPAPILTRLDRGETIRLISGR